MKNTENVHMKTVMVVEDDPSIMALVKIILERNDYQVYTGRDGVEAMELLEQGYIPDAIVMDTHLPKAEGDNFLRNLRVSGFYHDIPVLVIADPEEQEKLDKYLKVGVEDYVMKPFRPEELLIKIDLMQMFYSAAVAEQKQLVS